MSRDTCRYPSCDNAPAEDSRRYCSTKCELKYEHIKADAEDARIDAEVR